MTELIVRDLAKKDEIIKAAASSQPYLAKSLSEDLLAKISGGATQTYFEHCPRYGEWEVYETFPGGWEIYCPNCNLLIDASYIGDF